MIKSNTILVTGGAGFIGSNLIDLLLANGKRVVCFDNFNDYYDPKIKRNNIKEALQKTCFFLEEGDIRDVDAVNKCYAKYKFDLVIHLAAMAGVRPSILNPELYVDVNINGTFNILQACLKHSVKQLVFASSSSVYGNSNKLPFDEDDSVDCPISPYAATKKTGELLCHNWYHLHGISTVCLRFFTVYGKRQRPDLAIYKFTKALFEDKPISFYGDGTTCRDYTFIDDILDGIVRACELVESGIQYDIFNLGSGTTISLAQLVEILEKTTAKKAILDRQPFQSGDVTRTFASIDKAKRLLGYSPKTSFTDGIYHFVEWFKEQQFL